MLNLALRGLRCSDPLRRFSAHTADHVGMSEGLGSSLCGLHIEGSGDRLCNTGMEGGRPTRDDER
jgi:hypothetical protein